MMFARSAINRPCEARDVIRKYLSRENNDSLSSGFSKTFLLVTLEIEMQIPVEDLSWRYNMRILNFVVACRTLVELLLLQMVFCDANQYSSGEPCASLFSLKNI